MRIRPPFAIFLLVLLPFGFRFAHAQTSPSPAIVTIDGLGKGTVDLPGPWRFHIGDDLRWADPSINDTPGENGWETILADRPWGAQSHYAYTGFAWYRLKLRITPAPDVKTSFQLLLPSLQDSCEVYWNGRLVGRYGELPPHPSSPALNAPAAFTLPDARSGTLAIRVWNRPLGSSSSGNGGGIAQTPLVGDSKSIAAYIGTWNYDFLRSTLYINARNILYFLVALSAFVLWLRRKKDSLLLWFSIFAICPAIWTSVYTMRVPISSQFSQFMLQPLWALRNVALWFLLIEMLHLRNRRGLVRWAKILAAVTLIGSFLDGCLTYAPTTWISPHASAWIDVILTVIIEPCELYLLVLVAYGFRQKLDSVRWVLALSASLSSSWLSLLPPSGRANDSPTGLWISVCLRRCSIWVQSTSTQTFFSICWCSSRSSIRSIATFVTSKIAKLSSSRNCTAPASSSRYSFPKNYPLWRASASPALICPRSKWAAISSRSFRWMDRRLDPRSSFSATSAAKDYAPQWPSRSSWVLCVRSRKLPPARRKFSPVSVGASTAVLQGGFSTCVVLRLDSHGACTLASAGHPAPYFNDKEIDLPGALPLGIDPAIAYEEAIVHFNPGDRCALYTDGLLEARTPSGEIFSFERLQRLFASGADATQASEAAVAFGQDDDITVVTLTRLANA